MIIIITENIITENNDSIQGSMDSIFLQLKNKKQQKKKLKS
jgi:hypothetical protein